MRKVSESERLLHKKRERKLFEKLREEKNLREYRKLHIDGQNGRFESIILDMLSKHSNVNWIRRTHDIDIKIPVTFSIIEDPVRAINVVCESAKKFRRNPKARIIEIDHSPLSLVDLSAESILDLAIIEFRKERSARHKMLRIRGKLPTEIKLNRYIRAVGIIKNLDIKHHFLDEESNLRIFRMRNNRHAHRDTLKGADYKETVVDDFVQHIDSCIRDHKRQLTREGKKNLAKYTGEVLANSEEHSKLGDWSIAGYLDNSVDPHLCEIAIFNFGRTIYDTFKDLPGDHYSKSMIQPYIDMHTKKSLFEKSWNEENLITLVALQGGVSCMNTGPDDTRGNGTVDMIEFFQKVCNECSIQGKNDGARMAVVSGSTYILFDGTHKLKQGSDGRKIIAFNDENTLNSKPDGEYVKKLDGAYFPGTIISIRFPLESKETSLVESNG